MPDRLALVVDDDACVRRYVVEVVKSAGFQITEAEGGTEALHIIERTQGDVDLVISDIQMPGGNGIALAEAITASYPYIPVILVSGCSPPALEIECEFVRKPFVPCELLRMIDRVTMGRALRAAS
jgi:CheY-like chemotaxis protein